MTTAFQKATDLYDRGQLREALPLFQQAVDESPEDVHVLYRAALTLMAMRRYAECAAWLSRILPHINAKETPGWLMSAFHYNLGVTFEASGRWKMAALHMGKALTYNPEAMLPMIEMGSLAYRRGDPVAASQWHDRALNMKPDSDDALPALAFVKLLRGDYLGGFKDYEARWRMPQVLSTTHRPPRHWRWKGKDLKGKRIIVVSEQGIGDTIQMVRYLPMIEARGGKITLLVQQPLVSLMRYNFPSIEVIDYGTHYRPAQWWISLMSCPYVFGTTLETIPSASEPYLKAPQTAPKDVGFMRVGYVSKGNALHMADKDRSAPDGAFDPLFTVPGCVFIKLDEYIGLDFLGLAELFLGLDLVIAVDTAANHLAGALGVPCWLMPQTSEWRWGLTDVAPWYRTTHKLFRRTNVNAWPEVIGRVKTALEALT